MIENKLETKTNNKGGRQLKHGGYSLVHLGRIRAYLGACRAIEEYVAVDGFIKKGQMNSAINSHYVSFSMGVLRCLSLLGFDQRQAEEVLDLGRYKAAKVQEKAKRARSKPEVDHDVQA